MSAWWWFRWCGAAVIAQAWITKWLLDEHPASAIWGGLLGVVLGEACALWLRTRESGPNPEGSRSHRTGDSEDVRRGATGS